MSLDPQSQAVVNALNGSGVLPFRQFSPVDARKKILALRAQRPAVPTHEMASVAHETITTSDGAFVVRILRPRAGEAMPAIVYFHGGGFFAGGLDETDELARSVARQADAVVINVDYHLSPEAKFPVAVNDAYAALCWVTENARRLGVDPQRIAVAGDSAGGNLAAVTCLTARERGGPAIAFQALIYASLDLRARAAYGSREKWGGGGYILDNDDIEWMLDHYLVSRAEADDWRASPLLAASHAGLPPALVVTADHDPLCDEGRLYAERLAASGVAAEHVCFEGTFHGFAGYAGVLDAGKRGVSLIAERIKRSV